MPYEFPDRATLSRALLAVALISAVARKWLSGWSRRQSTRPEPLRRADPSYRFESRFRCLIAAVS